MTYAFLLIGTLMLKTIALFFILCLMFPLQAQQEIAVGAWRTHLTYYNAQRLALTPERVWVASQNGLFFYDQAFQTLEVVSKNQGLSDNGITALAYHQDLDLLLLGYQNGNLDLWRDDTFTNLPLLLSDNNFRNRRIYHIAFHQNQAYLSTDFGIVVLDLNRRRILNVYQNLGTNGELIPIYATAIFQNRLFAATDLGLRSVALNQNPQDFNNWQTLSGLNQKVTALAQNQERLFFALPNVGVFSTQEGSTATRLEAIAPQNFYQLDQNKNKSQVWITTSNQLYLFENQTLTPINSPAQGQALQAFQIDAKGNIWAADARAGLLTNQSGTFVSLYPSGTYSPDAFRVVAFENKILVLSGGYDSEVRPLNRTTGFYVFENGRWTNYNAENTIEGTRPIPALRDLVSATYVAAERKVYIASLQDGILVWNLNEDSFSVLNAANSPLPHNRVIDVKTDKNGNLWVALFDSFPTEDYYLRKTPQNDWRGFRFQQNISRYPLEMLIDSRNQIWVRCQGGLGKTGGILVFNENGENVYLTEDQNGLPSQQISSLLEDGAGRIWVGGDGLGNAAIKVFNNPATILNGNRPQASEVFFNRQRLLRDEAVSALALDGGDRKWVGTQAGLWLVGRDGDEIFNHFTTQNSPLFDNRIYSIAIQNQTGEVFFATPSGVISYRGTAKAPESELSALKIFPNPVILSRFAGLITLDGLTDRANVKITDIEGRLIFETESFGGRVTWNGTDYNGRQAKSGLYLVYASDRNGEVALVGKLAIVE
jgi:ligand-binding sensor domain-containing protein